MCMCPRNLESQTFLGMSSLYRPQGNFGKQRGWDYRHPRKVLLRTHMPLLRSRVVGSDPNPHPDDHGGCDSGSEDIGSLKTKTSII